MVLIISLGVAALVTALYYLPIARLDLNFVVLAVCTLALGSRILVKIPRLNSHIAVSDTFIFLTLLLYGGEAAIVLAAAEAYSTAHRFCNKWSTVAFNSATMAVATASVVIALDVFGLSKETQIHVHSGHYGDFVLAVALIALVQFFVNTLIAAGYETMTKSAPFVETWTNKYIWTFFTYLTGAIGAGIIAFFVAMAGFGVVFIALPIILLVFLAYRMYLTNVEMSVTQAEQAEQYALDLKARSVALRESEERFRSAFNYAPIGIALVGTDGRCLRVNHAMCGILGYTNTEFLDLDFHSLIFPDDLEAAMRQIDVIAEGRQPSCQIEQRFVHKDGHIVWASWSLSAAGDSNDGSNLIFQLQDITARKYAEEKLQHDATHDALTGLPNRMYFMQRLSAALDKKRSEPKYHVSVLFIDLDRFKYVNDSLGHLVGDELLIAISERLRESMRPPDIVARLGGDEFVILVEGRYYNEKVTSIADRIQKQFRQPFDLSGREVYSSASIGILHASEKHLTSEDIMRDADTAMYQAKHSGKARHEVFDESMRTVVKETLQLETDLRKAIDNGELEVDYQPIFSLSTGEISGVEALARWNHPELGEVSPGRFVALAEEIGWIDALSDQILRRVMGEVAPILREVPMDRDFRVGINLSSRQFANEDLVSQIRSIIHETNFPPTNLKLEITESVIFEYQDKAIDMLHQLRELGIGIDIDDFGTGYSNLSYLARMPISTLKIDRSFVSPISDEDANAEIVRTIISMARNLGLGVIAEGIESHDQLEMLIGLGCEFGQGYLLSRPLSREGIRRCMIENARVTIPPRTFDEIPLVTALQ
jgi:diguanylate cyclase (GGDEF)-like protein/PAS domain S-box-containing protein